ncbi:MAG: VWA domain-containing protein [Gemmataceae bacterium]|nr:VWA domain-containing protein [Gemmataceae bacterium]
MSLEQIPFGTSEFASNPEPRLACVLLVDTSGSMAGAPIAQLNDGLAAYRLSLQQDALASLRVEVAVVAFGGGVRTVSDFTTGDGFNPPTLEAGGDTPMGAAIEQALDMVRRRKDTYRANGVQYFRPWVWLFTDGEPTDEWKHVAARVRQGEAEKAFAFFAVGMPVANFDVLSQISVRQPLKLQGLQFREMFLWLSDSQKRVSQSKPGDEVPLAAPQGWASV